MPYYINPLNGTLAWDAILPPGAIETSDPNGIGAQHLAPADSWYALPGNGGRVYIKAGNPIPTSGNNQWATPYQAIDDQGTMPPDPNGGAIHTPGSTSADTWKLPGRGQFENQAWTGPSDWRGVPFAQMDTQGRPLSSYNNLVDQLQQSRQPIPIGQQFGRWNFAGGLLNQGGQGGQQTGAGGLLSQPATQPPPAPPRVTTDSSSAGGFFGQPQTPPPYQPNFVPQTPAPQSGSTQTAAPKVYPAGSVPQLPPQPLPAATWNAASGTPAPPVYFDEQPAWMPPAGTLTPNPIDTLNGRPIGGNNNFTDPVMQFNYWLAQRMTGNGGPPPGGK